MVRTDPPLSRHVIEALAGVNGAAEDGGWSFETRTPNRLLADLVRTADQAGTELVDVELRRPSLEDVFFELTSRPSR